MEPPKQPPIPQHRGEAYTEFEKKVSLAEIKSKWGNFLPECHKKWATSISLTIYPKGEPQPSEKD